jgi:PKD repeat protein
MSGYSIGFFFDHNILQVTSVTNGSAMDPYTSGVDFTYIPGHIFNNNGSVAVYTWALFSTATPPVITSSGWMDLLHVGFKINATVAAVTPIFGIPQQLMGFITTSGSPYETLFIDAESNDITPYNAIANATITYTQKVQAAYGPTAAFTITPNPVFLGTQQTFDGTASTAGWTGTATDPIVSYTWNFGDGNITTISTPIIYHTYAATGSYTVTLTVTTAGSKTNSTTETATVYAKATGCNINLYTQNWRYIDPFYIMTNFTGTVLMGPVADSFRPGDLVQLFANVTYNGAPVSNALVTFQVFDNKNNTILVATAISNCYGLVEWEFRIPWPTDEGIQVNNFTQGSWAPVENETFFGMWHAVATWQLGSQYTEQPPFEKTQSATIYWDVSWGLTITGISVAPNPAKRGPASCGYGDTVVVKVNVFNEYLEPIPALVTATLYDNLLVPLGYSALFYTFPVGQTTGLALPGIPIPSYAFVGTGYAVANILSTWPLLMGTAFSSTAWTTFAIEAP